MPVCTNCGQENPAGFTFCPKCGKPLAEAPADGRERRVVSVIFADLVGFTSRSERLDVEDVEGFLTAYYALLRRELERHGGRVEKFIGDAVVAVFGAPKAHEDDPERAVRAGLAIQIAMQQLREGDQVDVHVRVGVTTGEALVTWSGQTGEGYVIGDVVNTAARLQSAAPVDGVLVDAVTYAATQRSISYQPAISVHAKGKRLPVAAWSAVDPVSIVHDAVREHRLPLVGRADELAVLVAGLQRAHAEPSTRLVTLVGVPGVGKTRLVAGLQSYVREQPELVTWRQGRSLAYGEAIAFWAFGEMVKAQAGILESDSGVDSGAKLRSSLEVVITDDRDREWVERQLRPLVGLDVGLAGTSGSRVEAFAAWRRYVEGIAERGPVVLVFEDLHWADDALLDFIEMIVDRCGGLPLFIVCTARPELVERRPRWGGGMANGQTVPLLPLTRSDTARLVSLLLDQALLPTEVQEALLGRVDGNPLFAHEYVLMLKDRGVLTHTESGRWLLSGTVDELPTSVQGMIAARLDGLSSGEGTCVQHAAVIGRTAWVGAVSAVSGRPREEIEEAVRLLERKQLVGWTRYSSVADDQEFAFTHALIHEVAYARIPRMAKARLHEGVAAWITRLSGERDDKAELLAHHYSSALQLREQAHQETGDLRGLAFAAQVEAGRQAEAVYAHATAARHFEAALRLTRRDAADPGLVLEHAAAMHRAGTADETTLTAAMDTQVRGERWSGAAEASLMLAQQLIFSSNWNAAESVLEEAATYAARGPYTRVASEIAERRARLMSGRVDAAKILPFVDEGIRRAEAAGDDEGAALLLIWRGAERVLGGDAGGIDELARAADILASHEHLRAGAAYHNLAETLIHFGDLRRSGKARERASAWAQRLGVAIDVAYAKAGSVEAAYDRGEWDEARDAADTALDRTENETIAGILRWTRGRIALARGEIDVARMDRDFMLATMDASIPESVFMGSAFSALFDHTSADAMAALRMTDSMLSQWHALSGPTGLAQFLAVLAPIDERRGAIADAAALLPTSSPWRSVLTSIGEAQYAVAARVYDDMGSSPLAATAYALAAVHASATGDDDSERRYAARALAFYHQVRATRYAADLGESIASTSVKRANAST